MKWPGTSFVLLTVVFGILLFDIEFANGIKCYTCVNCDGKETGRTCGQHIVNPTSSAQSLGLGTERKFGDPPPGFEDPPPRFGNPPPGFLPDVVESDRCSKSEDEDGIVSKYCDHKANEANHKKLGFKCNEFGKGLKFKVCFCSTDLCNGAPKAIGNGNSKPLAIFTVITFVFTYSIVNLF